MRSFIWVSLVISPHSLSDTLGLVTIEHPPHSYVADNRVVGGVTEALETIFFDIGYSLDITVAPAKRAEILVKEGVADILYPVTYSDERNEFLLYSEPVAKINTVFFKRASSKIKWNRLEDLSDYVVGLNSGYNYPLDFQSAVNSQLFKTQALFTTESTLDNLRKLSLKRIDLYICNREICNYYINQYAPEFNDLDYIPKAIGPDNTFHVGFSRSLENADELLKSFNQQLQEMIQNERLGAIYKKAGIEF